MVPMAIIVVDLMVCRAVPVIVMGISTGLLLPVTFGVLQRLGIENCAMILIRRYTGAAMIRGMASLYVA
jgi:hypothetical protein